MRGIYRDRCEDGKNLVHEVFFEPFKVCARERFLRYDMDACLLQQFLQLGPLVLLTYHQFGGAFVDGAKLLRRGQTVGAAGGDARLNLSLEPGDPNREKFVEVIVRDRQKPDPLKQWVRRIGRLFEHARVEIQPRQFPVDKPPRRPDGRRFGGPGRIGGQRFFVSWFVC